MHTERSELQAQTVDVGPPPSFDEQALGDWILDALKSEFPIVSGSHALRLAPLSDESREAWGGQTGPLVFTRHLIYAHLHFEKPDHRGGSFSTPFVAFLCERSERSERSERFRERMSLLVEAFARVARRLMQDAQDTSFDDRPPLTPSHFLAALRALWSKPRTRHDEPRLSPTKTRTLAECEATMLGARTLEKILVIPAAIRENAVAALDTWLAAHTPLVETPTFQLVHVPDPSWSPTSRPSPQGVETSRAGLHVTLRTILWSLENGTPMITDVREQQVLLVLPSMAGDIERVIAFLDGLVATMPRAVEQWERSGKLCSMLPLDVMALSVLDLKKPQTSQDFAAALAKHWKLPR
ncbi:hypothetical protein [Chondromyces crocatus]|uniref:Uncharacterized protein n=1 Tax=Chondromyces crocatus TaxID=52 RepID=A0A0K1ED31_CHOCO|nr:hypothetical protein [Chondromyces crocatus]AKT38786.1 uncharacterized protein CMC5_029320 [Chondromyces crocatus]